MMGPTASDRSYLSIREVLELLVAEFPDVTISKIRFLEGKGLIQPERTPSGYRKFYDSDVERLRYILREQRENFLPLKVIKGRLEQFAHDLDHELSVGSRADSALVSIAATNGATSATTQPAIATSTSGAATPSLFSRLAEEIRSLEAQPVPAAEVRAREAAPAAHNQIPPRQGPDQSREQTRASTTHVSSYSAAELCATAGAEVALLNALESFGLVTGREMAGERRYDEEARHVLELAVSFDRFGVEPRHLRTIKLAAERDAGLFAQVVLPLLRQHNAAARERALAELSELEGLGAQLRDSFVKSELHKLIGG